jgi:hypothetical protein
VEPVEPVCEVLDCWSNGIAMWLIIIVVSP